MLAGHGHMNFLRCKRSPHSGFRAGLHDVECHGAGTVSSLYAALPNLLMTTSPFDGQPEQLGVCAWESCSETLVLALR